MLRSNGRDWPGHPGVLRWLACGDARDSIVRGGVEMICKPKRMDLRRLCCTGVDGSWGALWLEEISQGSALPTMRPEVLKQRERCAIHRVFCSYAMSGRGGVRGLPIHDKTVDGWGTKGS